MTFFGLNSTQINGNVHVIELLSLMFICFYTAILKPCLFYIIIVRTFICNSDLSLQWNTSTLLVPKSSM